MSINIFEEVEVITLLIENEFIFFFLISKFTQIITINYKSVIN